MTGGAHGLGEQNVTISYETKIERAPSAEAVRALASTSMFGGLGPVVLAEVAGSCVERKFARGEYLCHQGRAGDWLFVIGTGLVKVVFASPSGDEFLLATRGPGEVLGEVAVLDGVPRSASVVAMKPTTAYFISRARLISLMREHPSVLKDVLSALGGLVRRLTEQAGELAFLDLGMRLARLLLRLAEDQIFSAGQPEIGTMIGASRPAVNRGLQLLASQGAIEVNGRVITIKDLAALRASAMP
jgi:CRP/FNR family cyclic AMP-dependent transcriptional regulator